MADDKTPQLECVDGCVRQKRQNFGQWYFDSMENFPHEVFIRVDYDVVVKHDPWDEFKHDFDIAIAKETNGMMNNGIVLVKNRAFFHECGKVYLERTSKDGWNDIQVATQLTIDDGKFRVRKLDPRLYNVLPKNPRQYRSDAVMIHFKDKRKDWMLDEFRHLVAA